MNGLKLEDDVEQALAEEFQLPSSNVVRLAFSEAMVRHHANPDHVFNSKEFLEARSEAMSAYWSMAENREDFTTKRNDPNGLERF